MSTAGSPWLRYQAQPSPTPTPAAPPAGAPAGAPWERYQAQPTTPAAAPEPWDAPLTTPAPVDNRSFGQKFVDSLHGDPTKSTGSDVLDAVRDFGTGTAAGFSEVPATIGGVVHRIGGNLIGDSDRVTDAFKKATTDTPDTLAASGGKLFEGVAEWIVGEGVLKGLTQAGRMKKLAPVVSMLEQHPKIVEATLTHPEVFRYLPDAIRGGILGTTQTAAHGGTAGESLESGLLAGATGYVVPSVARGVMRDLGRVAEEVQPTVRDLEGARFRVLASEARGPNGEIIATPRAQAAADIANESVIRAERQGAFKQLHTNLAKRGVEQGLQQTNDVINASGSVSPNIRPTSFAGDWRYIPPDGSTALTGDEARSAMNEIRDQWLSRDWTPEQDTRFQQAYNDIRDQVKRSDNFEASQGLRAHDAAGAARGVENYRDAADLFDRTSNAKMQHIGELRSQYDQLIQARDDAQNGYYRAWNRGEDSAKALALVNASDKELENFVNSDAVQGQLAPGIAKRAAEEQRLSSAFRRLQNVTDRSFNLPTDTAEQINQPRLATRLGSLANDIEEIKTQYGDVLNPVLGDQGLNHITELGELLKTPAQQDAAKGYIDSILSTVKKHYQGGRGAAAVGATALLAHHLAGLTGVGTVAAAGLAGEAGYRMVLRKLATDPELATRFISAMRNGTPARIAGPLMASMITNINRIVHQPEPTNAPSQ
jgi:hypothetical protein